MNGIWKWKEWDVEMESVGFKIGKREMCKRKETEISLWKKSFSRMEFIFGSMSKFGTQKNKFGKRENQIWYIKKFNLVQEKIKFSEKKYRTLSILLKIKFFW